MPHSRKAATHLPIILPLSFTASSEQELGNLVAERLQKILPETDISEAILYMEEASLALSLSRSYQGIIASDFKELIPLFDLTFRGSVPDEKIGVLKETLKAEIESPLGHQKINIKAQRVKGVFHLLNAAELRLHSSHLSTA